MTADKPTLDELTAEAQEQETALMIEADRIRSDAYLGLLEARKLKVMLIAAETYQHLRSVMAKN